MDGEIAPLSVWVTKPRSEVAQLLSAEDVEIRAIEEDLGNVDRYVFGPQVAVERRAGMQFALGIQDKSLFLSAIFLRETYETPLFLLEGDVLGPHTGFTPQALRGALSALVLEYGVNVIWSRDADETASLLAMMARQAQHGVPEISLVPKRKAVALPDLQRRVVEMLPGCGRVTARDLLQYFGSIGRIGRATRGELQQVRGIGKKRAADIHRVLHAEYCAVDTERNLEDAIEAEPSLLFDHEVELVARQHVIPTGPRERHIVDLVYYAPESNALTLVELKRGALTPEHEAQLARYFGVAGESPLLRGYLERDAMLRGVLGTATPCDYAPASTRIRAVVVDESAVIDVLSRLRRDRTSGTKEE